MTPILDQIAATFRSEFQPSSPNEYFALRLAQKLGEPHTAKRYVLLVDDHPQSRLIHAFNRSLELAKAGGELVGLFHTEVSSTGANGFTLSNPRLAAIRIERRSLAAAVFIGTHLEGIRFRHLPSRAQKAEGSACGFVRSLLREFQLESVALETVPVRQEIQRKALTRAVRDQLQAEAVSIWEISKKTVLAAFAHPPAKTRAKVRKIIGRIWPDLPRKRGKVSALDAAALGLFVQTERLFNHF